MGGGAAFVTVDAHRRHRRRQMSSPSTPFDDLELIYPKRIVGELLQLGGYERPAHLGLREVLRGYGDGCAGFWGLHLAGECCGLCTGGAEGWAEVCEEGRGCWPLEDFEGLFEGGEKGGPVFRGVV